MAADLDAVVAGYVGVDLAPQFAAGGAVPLGQLLRPGKLVEVGPLEITPGGVVPNTGLALSAFGSRVALVGLIGEDRLGDVLLELLAGHGAELHLRRSAAAGTAYGLVIAPPGTDRVFLECPGCNATFTAADVDYDVVARSRLLHFGYPPLMPAMLADEGAELVALFARVRGLGVATSLDLTLPDPDGPAGAVNWRALLRRVLPLVDLFTPSLEELLYMLAPERWADLIATAGEGDPVAAVTAGLVEELAAEAVALGAGVVFLKAGQRGGYLRTGTLDGLRGRTSLALPAAGSDRAACWLPALPVDPARFRNACGAGDAAVAGFLTALLRGEGVVTAGRAGMVAGRDSLYGVDTTSGLRSWEALRQDVRAPQQGGPASLN